MVKLSKFSIKTFVLAASTVCTYYRTERYFSFYDIVELTVMKEAASLLFKKTGITRFTELISFHYRFWFEFSQILVCTCHVKEIQGRNIINWCCAKILSKKILSPTFIIIYLTRCFLIPINNISRKCIETARVKKGLIKSVISYPRYPRGPLSASGCRECTRVSTNLLRWAGIAHWSPGRVIDV